MENPFDVGNGPPARDPGRHAGSAGDQGLQPGTDVTVTDYIIKSHVGHGS